MNAIAVVDENWGLGQNGKLLVHLAGDLKYFKEITLGKTIIIGRGTYDSMSQKLLPGRETVIMSQNEDFNPGCAVVRSLDEALEYLKDRHENVFVAGGETIYRLFLPYCDNFYVTRIFARYPADRYFPDIESEPDVFLKSKSSAVQEENGVRYQFLEYMRKK